MGLYYARRLYRRADWLREVMALLDALEDRLAYTAAPLADLWRALATTAATARYPLVQDTAALLCDGVPFESAFTAAVERALPTPCGEREVLCVLGASLGRSGLSGQLTHIRRCREGLERLRQAACETAATRAPVYRMTGFSGGVCLALLLL